MIVGYIFLAILTEVRVLQSDRKELRWNCAEIDKLQIQFVSRTKMRQCGFHRSMGGLQVEEQKKFIER